MYRWCCKLVIKTSNKDPVGLEQLWPYLCDHMHPHMLSCFHMYPTPNIELFRPSGRHGS